MLTPSVIKYVKYYKFILLILDFKKENLPESYNLADKIEYEYVELRLNSV